MFMSMKEAYLILIELYERYKRTHRGGYDALAKDMGLAGGSSIQRYFKQDGSKKKYFDADIVEKFETAMVGKGDPPIASEEIWAMAAPIFKASTTEQTGINNSLDALLTLYRRSSLKVRTDFHKIHPEVDNHQGNGFDGDAAAKKNKKIS